MWIRALVIFMCHFVHEYFWAFKTLVLIFKRNFFILMLVASGLFIQFDFVQSKLFFLICCEVGFLELFLEASSAWKASNVNTAHRRLSKWLMGRHFRLSLRFCYFFINVGQVKVLGVLFVWFRVSFADIAWCFISKAGRRWNTMILVVQRCVRWGFITGWWWGKTAAESSVWVDLLLLSTHCFVHFLHRPHVNSDTVAFNLFVILV